jgi:hypothetical protein
MLTCHTIRPHPLLNEQLLACRLLTNHEFKLIFCSVPVILFDFPPDTPVLLTSTLNLTSSRTYIRPFESFL